MLFQAKKNLAKIATLEKELAHYYDVENNLREEMIYFSLNKQYGITHVDL